MRDDGLAEEAPEGYFASVSDLMVGVLFVFLLMLTVFALNYHDDSARLDELMLRAQHAEQQAKRAADAASRLRAQNETLRERLAEAAIALQRLLRDREQARAGLLQRLADRLDAAGVKFSLDRRSGVLRLSDAIPFATGRSDLSEPRAIQTVQVLGHVLAQVLPCFATGAASQDCKADDEPILETVLVEGHTDNQPYPSMTPAQSLQENDRLSAERALTVFTQMRLANPVLDALRNPSDQPLLGISGYGQRRPLPDAVSSAQADLTRNRRIDLRFVLASRTSDELQHLLNDIETLGQRPPE